jgi:hypothetical protein
MALSVSTTTRLQHQHESIQELIAGLSETQLKQIVQPGKWSAFEQIAHLTAYQPVFLDRLYTIEQGNSPAFQRYVAEQDAQFGTYLEKPLSALLSALGSTRLMMINYLTGLSEEALQKTGMHPRYGLLTVPEWTGFFLLHEAHHLYHLFMLTRELRLQQP